MRVNLLWAIAIVVGCGGAGGDGDSDGGVGVGVGVGVGGGDDDGGGGDDAPPDAPDEIRGGPELTLHLANRVVVSTSPVTISGTVANATGEVVVAVGTFTTTVAGDGTFSLVVEVMEGSNLLAVVASDAVGASSETSTVIFDGSAPELTLTSPDPSAGVTVNAASLPVIGTVFDSLTNVTVTVAGETATVSSNGEFSENTTLVDGANAVPVVAVDEAGNATQVDLDVTLYISPLMTVESTGGARVDLMEGALSRQYDSVIVRDLTSNDIATSLGLDGTGRIVDTMPVGDLPQDVLVLPGAMAITVDGSDLTGELIDPAMFIPSVPVMGGLINEAPLWIYQLIPDQDSDGRPELVLATAARISADGTRVVPVPASESGLPGIRTDASFGFSDATISQVPGIDHSSNTLILCCSSEVGVPVVGDTDCAYAATAQRLLEEARRFRNATEPLRFRWQEINQDRAKIIEQDIIGNSLPKFLVALAAGTIAAEGIAAAAVAVQAAGSLQAALAFFASSTSVGAGGAVALQNQAMALIDNVMKVIDVAKESVSLHDDIKRLVDVQTNLDAVAAQINDFQRRAEVMEIAAVELSNCSFDHQVLIQATQSARAGVELTTYPNQHLGVAVIEVEGDLALVTSMQSMIETDGSTLVGLVERFQIGTATDADYTALMSFFDNSLGTFSAWQPSADRAQSGIAVLPERQRRASNAIATATTRLDAAFAAFDDIPTSGGVPKMGVLVTVDGVGDLTTGFSSRGADGNSRGRFAVLSRTTIVRAGEVRTLTGRSWTVDASLGPLYSASTAGSFETRRFVGPGDTGFNVDAGTLTVAMSGASLIDSDADGITDGEEQLGGTNPAAADSDGDGSNDFEEIAAGSDPNDATSVPSDDVDGDGLGTDQEIAVGTSPINPDSDGDLLADGTELNIAGTNPLAVDTDSDGFTDWAEMRFGSDPTLATSTPGEDDDNDGLINAEEGRFGADPNDPDTDADTIDDGDEVYLYRTSPTSNDTDVDRILDEEEIVAGTDGFVTSPLDRDTDRDTFSDADEIGRGSDPTDPASIPVDPSGLIEFTVRLQCNGLDLVGAYVAVWENGYDAGPRLCEGNTGVDGRLVCPTRIAAGTPVVVCYAPSVGACFGYGSNTEVFKVADEGGGSMLWEVNINP